MVNSPRNIRGYTDIFTVYDDDDADRRRRCCGCSERQKSNSVATVRLTAALQTLYHCVSSSMTSSNPGHIHPSLRHSHSGHVRKVNPIDANPFDS